MSRLVRPLGAVTRKRRPWALVLANGHRGIVALTEAGELVEVSAGSSARHELERLGEHVIFTPDHRALLAATDARYWTAKQRRQRVLELRLDDGPKVCVLPRGLLPGDLHEAARTFATYLGWCSEQDVYPTARTSWGTLGRHLFASTLRRPVRFMAPDRLGRAGLYGGRKAAPMPGSYVRAAHYDISAAYLHALGTETMPRTLRYVKGSAQSLTLDSDVDGIAYAYVRVPPELEAWAPLPLRAAPNTIRFLKWQTGALRGWWSLSELRLAHDHGADVQAMEVYAGQHEAEHFRGWYEIMLAGRQLPHGAARLAKGHANLLWSSFGMAPVRITWRRYDDEYGRRSHVVKAQDPGDFTKGSAFVSALVAARLRVRLYRDALMPAGRQNDAIVQADTDGVIAGLSTGPALGRGPGTWRLAGTMPNVEIRAANAYRWACPECGLGHRQWHYKVAGAATDAAAERMFRRAGRSTEAIDPDTLYETTNGEIAA